MPGIRRVVGNVRAVSHRLVRLSRFLFLFLVLSGAVSACVAGAALAYDSPPEDRLSNRGGALTALTRGRTWSGETRSEETLSAETRIVINVPAFSLSLYAGDRLVQRYAIAVGTMVKPTVFGETSIINRVVDPTWYPKGRPPVPPGPENPVGTRWLGLSVEDLGIHGTNAPWSIGKPASSGCIRLENADVEELFDLVRVGTPVSFIYDTIQVYAEPMGRSVYVTVYQDIYQRGSDSSEELAARLEAAGTRIAPQVDRKLVDSVLRDASGRPVRFPAAVDVSLDGEQVPGESAVWLEDELWVPVAGVARLLGATVAWDWEEPERNQKAAFIHHAAGVRFKESVTLMVAPERARIVNGRLHLRLEDLDSALKVRATFSAEQRAVFLESPSSRYLRID